jgi:hypothetical protein
MNNCFTPLGMDCRTWNGVEIQRRPSDGYVNATAMCKAHDREWSTYARAERTKEYIKALEAVLQNCGTELVQSIWGGLPHLQGTWVHPRLAVDLARWLSPAFAVWMDGWFLDVMRQKLQGGDDLLPIEPRPTEAAAAPIRQGATAHRLLFCAPPAWGEVVERYVADVDAEMAQLPPADRPRSRRFARPLAQHFMQYLINNHAQLMIPANPAAVALPVAPVSSAGCGGSSNVEVIPEAPVRPRGRRNHGGLAQRLTAPELAHRLGIDCSTLNAWARRHGVGAVRDGWKLIGKGRLSCDITGWSIPQTNASWLWERMF